MTRSQREAAILAELRGGPLHFDMIKIGGRHSHAHEMELRRMAKAGLVRRPQPQVPRERCQWGAGAALEPTEQSGTGVGDAGGGGRSSAADSSDVWKR